MVSGLWVITNIPLDLSWESALCPAVILLNFPSHSPNTMRLSFFPRSWAIHLFSHSFCMLDFLHLSLLNSLSSWLFPSPRSFFFFLFPFLSSSAAVFPPSLPPSSLLSHFYHSIHILLISSLIQYLQGGIQFSHFGLINTPLLFFAFCTLLSLAFSPCLSLRGSLPPPSPAGAQVPPAALTPAEGNSGFSWAPCWQEKGARAHSQQPPFSGGLSSQGGWEKQELLICLRPTWSQSPAAWAPFAPPPRGSQFITVTDSSRLSLSI